jgi:IMP dehydrogenase/GMP reductase
LNYICKLHWNPQGADFVMSGGMFAAHTESGGELVEIDGKVVILTIHDPFYPMNE